MLGAAWPAREHSPRIPSARETIKNRCSVGGFSYMTSISLGWVLRPCQLEEEEEVSTVGHNTEAGADDSARLARRRLYAHAL